MSFRRVLACAAVIAAFCTGAWAAADARAQPIMHPTPEEAAEPSSPDARFAEWRSERPGEPVEASLTLRSVLEDETVLNTLTRYGLRPYAAHLAFAGESSVYRVAPEAASASVVPDARARSIETLLRRLCRQGHHIGEMRGEDAVRLDEREGDPTARSMLSKLLLAEDALERLEAGAAQIYGLFVVGSEESLRRAARDPYIAAMEPADLIRNDGQTVAALPQPDEPASLMAARVIPKVSSLSVEEVRTRLDRRVSAPPRSCPSPDPP